MRALLTGISGFIGGRLASRLDESGWDVHGVVRRPVPPSPAFSAHLCTGQQGELAAILAEVKPDVVFHLASLFLVDHQPDQIDALVESNILFPLRLTEAMAASGVSRLVNTGTAWQYDPSGAYRPVNLYAATKQAFQDVLAYEHDARALSSISLQLFDTYGRGDPRRKLISILIGAAASGERLDMSPGEQIVDLTHVDDVVNAFICAADYLLRSEAPTFKTYFVSGERMSVRDLVSVVSQALGRPIDACFGGRRYRPREVMMPATPDPLLPGWHRRHSLLRSLPTIAAD